jgi:hypothetical protein
MTNLQTQILRVEHQDLVLSFLESQVEQFDKYHANKVEFTVDAETSSNNRIGEAGGSTASGTTLPSAANLVTYLGAKQKSVDIETLLKNSSTDDAFTSFHSRLLLTIRWLSSRPGETITINDSHKVRQSFSRRRVS